ncbi:MAG: hypothetical protein JNL83_10105 [Myxococcales bacterium]|nr:hypothetical protein [Myxococcales bacterium]
MGVFALAEFAPQLQAWAIAAARELGLFAGRAPEDHRERALVAALAQSGVDLAAPPPASSTELPREGWGRLAEVIRTGRPLPIPDVRAYHAHLLRAGAEAARELAPLLAASSLVDLGGGGGAYSAAFLDAHPAATATVVDSADVIAIARDHLARFGARAAHVAGDARDVALEPHGAALLANVLHLHGPDVGAELVRAAARAVAPGGLVVLADLDAATPEGIWFSLDMALYTEAGRVYPTEVLRGWLDDAGLVEIAEARLASAPEVIVVTARRPRGSGARFAEATGLAAEARAIEPELASVELPGPLLLELSHALALERREREVVREADLRRHYLELMPAQRAAQVARPGPLLSAPLDWSRLPRMTRAIDRLFAVLADADVAAEPALGAATAAAFRARTPTLAVLYARTHYASAMPLLYGNDADLAYFTAHGGPDAMSAIDRYLTTPMLHELCHLSPTRDALHPLHLDECVAGWLGVHVHPEFAYPAEGHDDAIFAAPWLSQIGQAIVRAFGMRAVVRGHAGAEPWDRALPAAFVDAVARRGWEDWRARRTLHFLSDTMDPAPWVELALGHRPLAPDAAADRGIVEDALRAMCLENVRIEGSFRARTRLPEAPITIDAPAGWVVGTRRGEVDTVAPRYWLPPDVAARLGGVHVLELARIAAIPPAAAAICAAAPGGDLAADGFSLRR